MLLGETAIAGEKHGEFAVAQLKDQRLIVDEVNANNAETGTRAEMWLDELKKSCDRVNAMFDINVSVDWRVNPYYSNKGGVDNGIANSDGAV